MKKLDERERWLLAPPPFLLSSRRQVVFTVPVSALTLPQPPVAIVQPHYLTLQRQHVYSLFPFRACLASLFFNLNVVKKGRSLSGYKTKTKLQKNKTKNKLQSCKRTNVSGSEDAHTP